MSKVKQLFIGFLVLMLGSTMACGHEPVLLETGEVMTEEIVTEHIAETENRLLENDSEDLIYVYVCGQVAMPGVYSMLEGDRIFQAVEMAGGILPEGDATRVNLAEPIYDGQKIYIPSIEEAETWDAAEAVNLEISQDLVNINQATKEVLMTLPGIGEAKADAIIAYRQEHGSFRQIDALMEVPGIKEGVYSKIKDRISID